ncbi:hypothetical protein ONZ45_g5132 [Pleurotus djamor]|nr:hypothetical protein ONZ45_g5132 [Pleurotus djamor]
MFLLTYVTQWLAALNIFVFRYTTTTPASSLPDLYEASIHELQAGLDAGQFSSVDLVNAYFARIDEVNLKGPALRAVLELNPSALRKARELDAEREIKGKRGMNTTAGSYSLLGSIVPEDAGVVKRLRKAGAIILGKANLCEFSHARGLLASGWSGRGGQTTGAYLKNANPCGSSGGSAVAASIGLVTVSLGTETGGSITCPAGFNNLVGIKPTVGLTSRAGVIPYSLNQDTIGPIARSVTDAATVLSVIAGKDPNDNFTWSQPEPVPDFMKALSLGALKGKRIGATRRGVEELNPVIEAAFNRTLNVFRRLGAIITDPADIPTIEAIREYRNQSLVVPTDLKANLNAYYGNLIANPSGVTNLAELIKFNDDNPDLELPLGYEDQSIMKRAQSTTGFNSTYWEHLEYQHELGRTKGIDAVLRKHRLDALVMPAVVPNPPAAIAGYPIITVPLGFFPENTETQPAGPSTVYPGPGIPFGLSFVGTAFSEYNLIGMAYAYEQATQTRLMRRAYKSAIPVTQLVDILALKRG